MTPLSKWAEQGGWWVWPKATIRLLGLWLVYKPSFNPIGQVAVEIQTHFQSGRGRGLVDMAKPRRRVYGVMAGIQTKFQPNRPSGRRDTTPFSKWAGQGAGG